MTAALIGLDWGTTSFRAYRIDADGAVVERRMAPRGILQVEGGAFEAALNEEIGDWLAAAPDIPVLASGMITSRQGWLEAPYVGCPAGADGLAAGLVHHDTTGGRTIRFVPGISVIGADGVPDVIRGEETQVVGALQDPAASALMVLPGTHSKWVVVEAGRITAFATFMTGEVFGVMKAHSILGRLMAGDAFDSEAFARGLQYAGDGGSGLLKRLFSARTLALFDRLPNEAVASYLSGLLIGTEIEEARAFAGARRGAGEVTVIAAADLEERYRVALERKGLRPAPAHGDAAARGLFRIARAAGLIA